MTPHTDLCLVLGLVLAALSVPAFVAAYSDGRRPIAPVASGLIAAGLVAYALGTAQGAYALADVPEAFYRVVARFLP